MNQNRKSTTHQKPVEIFPAALWASRHIWRDVTRQLTSNSCVLVVEGKNERLTQVMEKLAQSFRNKGQKVLILKWKKVIAAQTD